jgi:hypothetical protein
MHVVSMIAFAFDPVGTDVAWTYECQIDIAFLERKVHSDRIAWWCSLDEPVQVAYAYAKSEVVPATKARIRRDPLR